MAETSGQMSPSTVHTALFSSSDGFSKPSATSPPDRQRRLRFAQPPCESPLRRVASSPGNLHRPPVPVRRQGSDEEIFAQDALQIVRNLAAAVFTVGGVLVFVCSLTAPGHRTAGDESSTGTGAASTASTLLCQSARALGRSAVRAAERSLTAEKNQSGLSDWGYSEALSQPSAVGEAGEEEAGSAFAAILLITAISLVVVGASAGPKLKLGLKKVFSA